MVVSSSASATPTPWACTPPPQPPICCNFPALSHPPMQAVQEAGARTTSSVIIGLCNYYPLGQYAPAPAMLPGLGEGVVVECYVDKYGGGCGPGARPGWHVPSPEEVRLVCCVCRLGGLLGGGVLIMGVGP